MIAVNSYGAITTNLSPVSVVEDFDSAATNYDPESSSSLIHKYTCSTNIDSVTFHHFGAVTNTADGTGKAFYIDATINVATTNTKWYYYFDLPLSTPMNLHGDLALSVDVKMDLDTLKVARISIDDYIVPLKSEVGDGKSLFSSDANQWMTMSFPDLQDNFNLNTVTRWISDPYQMELSDIGRTLRHVIIKVGATGSKTIKVYIDNYSLTGTQMEPAAYDAAYIAGYSYPAWHDYLSQVRADIDIRNNIYTNLSALPILPAEPSEKQDYQYKRLQYYRGIISNNIAYMYDVNSNHNYYYSHFQAGVMEETDEAIARYTATLPFFEHSIDSPPTDFDLYNVPAMKYGWLDGYTFPMIYSNAISVDLRMTRGEYSSIALLLDPAPGYNETMTVENSDFTNTAGTIIISSTNLDMYIAKIWYQAGQKDTNKEGGKMYLTQELLLKNENLVRVTHGLSESSGTNIGTNELYINHNDTGSNEWVNISTYSGTPDASFPDPDSINFNDADTIQPFTLGSTYKLLWGILHVPTNTPAGTYTSTLNIKNSGGAVVKSLPITVQVLPFDLDESPLRYSLYYHGKLRADKPESSIISLSSFEKTTAQQRLELRDMRDHGVLYPAGYEDDIRTLPLTLGIRNDLGLPQDRFFSLGKSFTTITTNDILQWQDILESNGYDRTEFYVYGREEASAEDLVALIQHTENDIYSVGGKVFTAVYDAAVDVISNYMDVAVYAGGPLTRNVDEQVAKWHAAGQEIYSYGAPQVGVENPEVYRRNFGMLLLQKGFDGGMDYAYQKEYGVLWNDFDSSLDEPTHREEVFAYQTTTGIVGTIEWEGYRAAITDVRYFATLLNLRDQLENNGTDVTALNNWIDNIDPFSDLDEVRNQIVDKILELMGGDLIPPVITLFGNSTTNILVNSTYIDAGATVTDNYDTSVAIVTNNPVNTSVTGTYYVTYNATDSASNAAVEVMRTVIVNEQSSGTNTSNSIVLLAHFNDTNSWNIDTNNGDYALGDTNVILSGSGQMWGTGFFSASSPENKAFYATDVTPKIRFYANDGNVPIINPTGSVMTIGFWIKITGNMRVRPIIIRSGNYDDYVMFDYGYNSVGKWALVFQDKEDGSGSAQYKTFALSASAYITNWVYFATIIDLSNETVTAFGYDNNATLLAPPQSLSITVNNWAVTSGAAVVELNYKHTGANNLWLDELSIDNKALTEAEISSRVAGMVAGSELSYILAEESIMPTLIIVR